MGLFDGKSYSTGEIPTRSSHSRAHSSVGGSGRRSSPARSIGARSSGNGNGYFVRPSASSSSHNNHHGSSSSNRSPYGDFGLGNLGSLGGIFGNGASSSRGIFGGSNNGSYYKRRPRDGYVAMLIHKLQRMLKELWYYAKKNPVKAFFAVVVPLLSAGGAVHGLLRQFGVRLPLLDGGARRGGGGYYGSSGYDGGSSRMGGIGGGGGGGWMENAGSLMQVAKMFM